MPAKSEILGFKFCFLFCLAITWSCVSASLKYLLKLAKFILNAEPGKLLVLHDWEMKDSTKKSSRVSPAQAANLRQAKSLLLKDRFARVSTKPKSSCSNAVRSKNHLAWYVALTKQSEKKTYHIPQIKWKCPPKFALNIDWRVAAGEGSQEAEAQKCRELAVSETVNTDLTAIPPCPITLPHLEGDCHNSSQTLIIPTIPIEEVAAEMPSDTSATVNATFNPQPPASCPSVSGDLPFSQSGFSESQDQSVHGKSLTNLLHGLESGDLEIAAAAAATVAAVMQSKDHIDTGLLIKFLSDPEMIKKLMNGNGLTSKPEDEGPPAPKAVTSLPLPSSTPASVVDKLPNSEPVSKAVLSNSTTKPVNQFPIQPCSKVETEIKKATSKPGGTCPTTHTSKPAKRLSQSSRFISDGLTKKLTACSHTREQKVRPLMPSTLRPDERTNDRLVKKYGGPDITGVKPVNSLNPSTSMVHLQAMKKMIHDYGAPDVARVNPMVTSNSMLPNMGEMHRNPFVGPSPPLVASSASPPGPNLNALPINHTGNFLPSFTPMAIPARGVHLQYHNSLIKQHGEIHETGNYLQGLERGHRMKTIDTNPKYRKPCIYFTSSAGCRNGSNCLFQHDVPKQWRAQGPVKLPLNRVSMTPVAKRMELN